MLGKNNGNWFKHPCSMREWVGRQGREQESDHPFISQRESEMNLSAAEARRELSALSWIMVDVTGDIPLLPKIPRQ